MESTIKHIIEMDEQARQLTLDAKKLVQKNQRNTEIKKQALKKEYLEKAMNKISELEKIERELAEKNYVVQKQNFDNIRNSLNEKYEKNKDIWTDEIINKVLSSGR